MGGAGAPATPVVAVGVIPRSYSARAIRATGSTTRSPTSAKAGGMAPDKQLAVAVSSVAVPVFVVPVSVVVGPWVVIGVLVGVVAVGRQTDGLVALEP